jgi:hypothetical protein
MNDFIELSEIQAYLRCPRQYWFRYHLRLHGGRDTGYMIFHKAVYSALSPLAEQWNQTQQVPASPGDFGEALIGQWPDGISPPWDNRDLYRRERAMPVLNAFIERLQNLKEQGRAVQIAVQPPCSVKLVLVDDSSPEESEVFVRWSIGHTEIEDVTRAFLHKFSRRKTTHKTQADHFALSLLPEAFPSCLPGIWYPIVDPLPDMVEINGKSAETARGKIEKAARGIIRLRMLELQEARPDRCEDESVCRGCAYRFNCFDGKA